jgi:hypothetical protein
MRINGRNSRRNKRKAYVSNRRMPGIAVTISCFLLVNSEAKAGSSRSFCSQTADALLTACRSGINDDSFVKKAICINISDAEKRGECLDELQAERKEGGQLCTEQRAWRLDACRLLGDNRYDPDFDPTHFDDDFTALTNPNLYFPLTIGNQWEYRGGGEVNTVEILNETKAIEGVTCIVAHDQVFKNGDLTEDTDDWYAQALDRNVWYFGEETKDFDSFDGDKPRAPELLSIEGSFKAGRNGDKPGLIFLASPRRGDVYLEEFSLANAEDVTVILSTNYAYGHDAELDQFVPRDLVERFCSGDCVVTKNFSLLEPGIFARKYYARGVGVILEVEPDDQVVVSQLVNCNFDPRCVGLPTP